MSSITEIPDELIKEIISKAGWLRGHGKRKRFTTFALVCKRFHALAYAFPYQLPLGHATSIKSPLRKGYKDLIDSMKEMFAKSEGRAEAASFLAKARALLAENPFDPLLLLL